MSICQYPELQSNVENTSAGASESMESSIRGIGYESRILALLRRRESKHKPSAPHFFGANTIGATHSEVAGLMTSSLSIFSIYSSSKCLCDGPIWLLERSCRVVGKFYAVIG